MSELEKANKALCDIQEYKVDLGDITVVLECVYNSGLLSIKNALDNYGILKENLSKCFKELKEKVNPKTLLGVISLQEIELLERIIK